MIPDPIQRMNQGAERLFDEYEEGVCMGCNKKVDYQLVCPDPMGEGPALCVECCPEGHGVMEEVSITEEVKEEFAEKIDEMIQTLQDMKDGVISVKYLAHETNQFTAELVSYEQLDG